MSKTTEDPERDLRVLYELLRHPSAESPHATLEAFLRHTDARRKKAVKHALDVWRIAVGNHDDVMQQVICHVTERWLAGKLKYVDQGLSAVDGWVGQLWDHEASRACRRIRLQDRHGITAVDSKTLDERAAAPEKLHVIDRLLELAARLKRPLLKAIMVDQILGLSTGQSATSQNLSTPYVCRLRRKAHAEMRSLWQEDDESL